MRPRKVSIVISGVLLKGPGFLNRIHEFVIVFKLFENNFVSKLFDRYIN